MDKEEGRRSVGGRFYSRARTRALTHVAGFSGFLVDCGVFDRVLVLVLWRAEKAGTHAVDGGLVFWKRGTVSKVRRP